MKTNARLADAARIVRKHYGLDRPVSAGEVAAEMVNLRRKMRAGTADDSQKRLAAALGISEPYEFV